MTMTATPKDYVAQMLRRAAGQVLGDSAPKIDYSGSLTPDEHGHAEFASNIALVSARRLKQPPMQLAESLAANLRTSAGVRDATAAAPGFININLEPGRWLDWLNGLTESSFSSSRGKGQRVSLEFVSANPTGPLVLTNAWQAYFGDILGRVYTSQGYTVEREYLVNDTGTQITILGKSIQAAAGKKFDREETETFYKGEYVAELARQLATDIGGNDRVSSADPFMLGQKAADLLLDGIKATLMRLGVAFDDFYSDSQVDNQRTLNLLQEKDATLQRDGAIWLKSDYTGTGKDEVLVRSQERGPTYFLNDISYQLNRLQDRGYELVLSVVGPDHHGQAIRLTRALNQLGYENFTMLSTQTVRLVRQGKEVKMSKRVGNFVLLDDFLDEVPGDAARFLFGSRDINTHLDFDLDVVRSQTPHNPLYYCMYAYVRAASILAKAKDGSVTVSKQVSHELNPLEMGLVRQMCQVPDVLDQIISSQRVHSLFGLFQELARRFHDYYESERILALEDAAIRASKLAFIAKLQMVFEMLFALVGVVPQEKM